MITLLYIVVAILAGAVYLLPTIIALLACDERHTACIMIINLLLGWTILGWFIALLWSILAPRRTP